MPSGSPPGQTRDTEIPLKEQLLEIPFHTYVIVEQILKKELEESEKSVNITGLQKISKNKAALVQKWVSRAITRVHTELQSRVSIFHDSLVLSDTDKQQQTNTTICKLKGNDKQSTLNSIPDISKEVVVVRDQVKSQIKEELKNLEDEREELKNALEKASRKKTEISKKLSDIKKEAIQEMQSAIISDVTDNSERKIFYSPSKSGNCSSLIPAEERSLIKKDDNVNNFNKALMAVNEGHESFKKNITETFQTINSLLEETPHRLEQYKETVESVKAFLSEKPSKLDQLMSTEIVNISKNDENIDIGNQSAANQSKSKRGFSEVSTSAPGQNETAEEQNDQEIDDYNISDDHALQSKKQKLQQEKIISCLEDHLAFNEEELIDASVGKSFDMLY